MLNQSRTSQVVEKDLVVNSPGDGHSAEHTMHGCTSARSLLSHHSLGHELQNLSLLAKLGPRPYRLQVQDARKDDEQIVQSVPRPGAFCSATRPADVDKRVIGLNGQRSERR